jgi:hypothetical protein|nr:hypothetical protein Q903MT_gene3012 [Picea sitchensis]
MAKEDPVRDPESIDYLTPLHGNPCILMSTATARISIIPYQAIDLYMETDRYTYPSIYY